MSQPEVVFLESSDDSAAVRERLGGAEAKRVLLVVPKGSPGLDNLVDLKLLGRRAIALDKQVGLVTRDRELRELARSLGFRTFSSVETGQKANWERWKPLAMDSLGLPRREGRARFTPAGARSRRGVGAGEIAAFSAVLLAMLACLALILVVFVPSAKVTLEPVSYPVSTTITVLAGPDLESVDFVNLRVPAKVVEIELVGNDEIPATAIRNEPTVNATGQVVFTNKRTEATTVVTDTVVTTSTGTTVRFRTTEEVTLAPRVGGRARSSVEAIEPGPGGNVPAYSINRVEGPLDRQVNVINVEPTEGGEMSEVTYVTHADKQQLMEALLQRLRQEGYDALMVELSGEELLPPESLVSFVLSETYDKFPGDVADSLRLHMRALIRGTVIDRDDVESLGLRMLQLEVREGLQLLPEATEVRIEEVSDADYDGTLTLEVRADGVTWLEIDELDLREAIKGKPAEQAEEYLARHLTLVGEPSVDISPKWWGRLPWLPFRIAVHVASIGTG